MAVEYENNMNVMTSEIDTFKDLAKNWLWQATLIPEEGTPLAELFKSLGGTRQFTVRCRTATIPERSVESELETNWQGSKKIYPGRTKMDGESTLKFDEFQDWRTSHMIHSWMNLLYNNNIDLDGGDTGTYFDQLTGAAVSNNMRDYSARVRLTCYGSNLKPVDGKDYVLYYAWPKTKGSIQLDQGGQEKIEPELTLRYSTYQEVNPVK